MGSRPRQGLLVRWGQRGQGPPGGRGCPIQRIDRGLKSGLPRGVLSPHGMCCVWGRQKPPSLGTFVFGDVFSLDSLFLGMLQFCSMLCDKGPRI